MKFHNDGGNCHCYIANQILLLRQPYFL